VSLRIEYTELELPFTSGNPLEPRYSTSRRAKLYALTGSSDNLFVSPNHQYKLAKPTPRSLAGSGAARQPRLR